MTPRERERLRYEWEARLQWFVECLSFPKLDESGALFDLRAAWKKYRPEPKRKRKRRAKARREP